MWSVSADLDRQEQAIRDQKEKEKLLLRKEQEEMLTIYPEYQEHEGRVEVRYSKDESKIMVRAPRNEVFMKIVSDLRFSWGTNCYYRIIAKTMGLHCDRITELVTTLVAHGFAVFIDGEDLYKQAKAGKFDPEQLRWISYNKEKQCLAIWWRYRDQQLYQKARKIRSSTYDQGKVLVSLKYRRMVKKFCEENDFSYTEEALKAMERYERKEDNE